MIPVNPPQPPYYLHPPIIERVASVYCEMTEETFESRLEDWTQMVREDFPVYEPLKEWLINFREVTEDKIPVLDTTEPVLKITPRFSRKSSKEGFDWSIRCAARQFTMNMHSNPTQGESRRYTHLRSEFAKWLPRWMQHFGVETVQRISLHYVNELSRQTVPKFYDKVGNLLLGNVITVFTRIPGDHECLMPPLDCRATVKLPNPPDATLQLTVKDWLNPAVGPAVLLDFVVQVPVDPAQGAERIIGLLDEAHDHIVKRFELVFTPEAKSSFKPAET